VDTTKAVVAQQALEAGAAWINDISAGRFDPAMASVVAAADCGVILMHSRHTPQTMQLQPHYDNVVVEVCDELRQHIDIFLQAGVDPQKIVVDPGIGFAKRFEDNVALLAKLDELARLGYPLLVGTSRKSFIGQLCGRDVQQRLGGSLGSVTAAYLRGARLFRVHDVAATRDALTVFSTLVAT
jgi:dihydropteroate synthase